MVFILYIIVLLVLYYSEERVLKNRIKELMRHRKHGIKKFDGKHSICSCLFIDQLTVTLYKV